jgi:MerR family transcriptional regulator, light-induced transcriptional regulator
MCVLCNKTILSFVCFIIMSAYKIKDLELLSGIKAHTIRMWEKRYGILSPERTDTQIRTYSDEDLTDLLNISILNQNGIKISNIARMSAQEIKEKVRSLSDEDHQESAVLSILISALIEMDEVVFERMVNSLIRKEGLTATYFNYFLPFLERIGVMWIVGTINPAQEHFISALMRNRIIIETAQLHLTTHHKGSYVVFCRPNEHHEISLLFYNYLLRKNNASTLYLGQNLPLDALEAILASHKIKGFVSSFVAPMTATEETELIRLINRLKTPFYVGGNASSNLLKSNNPMISPIQDLLTVEK